MKEWILPLIMWLTLVGTVITSTISLFINKGRYLAPMSLFMGSSFLHLVNDIYFNWGHLSLLAIAVMLKILGIIAMAKESDELKNIDSMTDRAMQVNLEKLAQDAADKAWRDQQGRGRY